MLHNIMLIIRKIYLGRDFWLIVLTVGFFILFFPLVRVQYISGFYKLDFYRLDFFALWCVATIFAYNSVYADISSTFSIKYNKAGVVGVLPVTRLEMIVARYVYTFVGVLMSAIVLFIYSIIIANNSLQNSSISFASLSVLLPSFLFVIVFANLLLLSAGLLQNTIGMFIGGIVSGIVIGFSFIIVSGIARWFFSNFTLNGLELTAIALAAVLVTITTAALNYMFYKEQMV